MVRKLVSALTAMAALAGPVAARGAEPEILKRSAKWLVEYDRDACHVYAEFGAGDDKVIARMTRYSPGDGFRLSIYGNRVRTTNVNEDVKIDFGLKGGPIKERVLTGTAGKIPALFFGLVRLDGWRAKAEGEQAPPITPEEETLITGVTIAQRGKKPFRLQSGSFGKPLAVMRHCMSNLVKSWGYDPDVQARLTRSPVPVTAPNKWFSDDDYPIGALMMGQSGIVQFRLDIDPQGKIAGCYVLDRTEPDEFAAIACRGLTRRGKFQPALDADGKPVRSFFVSAIRFVMPG